MTKLEEMLQRSGFTFYFSWGSEDVPLWHYVPLSWRFVKRLTFVRRLLWHLVRTVAPPHLHHHVLLIPLLMMGGVHVLVMVGRVHVLIVLEHVLVMREHVLIMLIHVMQVELGAFLLAGWWGHGHFTCGNKSRSKMRLTYIYAYVIWSPLLTARSNRQSNVKSRGYHSYYERLYCCSLFVKCQILEVFSVYLKNIESRYSLVITLRYHKICSFEIECWRK